MKLLIALVLVALVGAFVEARPARDLKEDLITKGNDLVTQAEAAIATLEAASKTQEAARLKTEEAHLKKAVADLNAATDAAQITRLEHELQMLEARLAQELARISGQSTDPVVVNPVDGNQPTGPQSQDHKEELITKGNDLVAQAEAAITKLEADKKTQEAAHLKTEEEHLKKLIEDITAATEAAQITRLEHELQMVEARLAQELARINGQSTGPVVVNPVVVNQPTGPVTRDLKEDLITKGNDLVTQAEAAITKLEADKKAQEAARLKTEEEHLKKLVADLTAATEAAQITRLEHELQMVEARLAQELARINGQSTGPVVVNPVDGNQPGSTLTEDQKAALITKGNDLVTQTEEAITKLEADKKTQEAAHLKTEEEHLKKLIEDLTAATEGAQITRLEHELQMVESRLVQELARINGQSTGPVIVNPPTGPVTRDLKADLITKGNDLVTQVEAAIAALEAANKAQEAARLKTEEAHLKKAVADLTAATDAAQITRLEHELQTLENRLATELARINQSGSVLVTAAPAPST